MTRDTITLANILPTGCNTAEQYITAIITEARAREGRTLEGWTFDPAEATLCMMLATKAVNDAWDDVPIDDPTASDDDAYVLAIDRAFRSIVADRDREHSATIDEPTAEAADEPTIEEPTATEEPTTEEPTAEELPAIEAPAPSPSQPSLAAPYTPADLDNPDCTIMIDGQTYRDTDGDYHHLNADETLYISIPQNLEGVTSATLAGDDHEVLRVAMEQHGCKPIDTPNALLRILKEYKLVITMHEVMPDPDPTTDELPTIEAPTAPVSSQPVAEEPKADTPAPALTAPATAPSNEPKAVAADVQAVLDHMPTDPSAFSTTIRKAAPNFKLMLSIDAVANARTIEWSMPDPTHVTLTATEADGTIWSQREDIKNGGRRVTVTEADGTTTLFKSVGKLIAFINGTTTLEDAIKSTRKAKPAPAPEAPSASIEQPATEEPTTEAPTIDEQPTVEQQPSTDATTEEPTTEEPIIDEQPAVEQPAVEQPAFETAYPYPTPPVEPSTKIDIQEYDATSQDAVDAINAELAGGTPITPKAAMRGKPLPSFHHPKFDDILTLSKAGFAIYMYGPAGTGKSTIVKQCAKAMGLEYTTISSPTMEHKVEGFIDAQGIFRSTQFRDAFEHGKVFDMAEIDNIPSEVLVIMNDALSDGCFAFPDGLVYMHHNFRCFASGNTAGKGADGAYTARKILDAASLDRFELIRIDYDEQVEINIATDDETGNVDTDALEFVHDFRRVMADSQPNFVVSYRRLKSLLGMVKCFKGDYEKAVRYAIVRELADQRDDLRNIVMAMSANTNNPYYCALRTIVQKLFGKGKKSSVAA